MYPNKKNGNYLAKVVKKIELMVILQEKWQNLNKNGN